jgi:N-acetylglucosamine-6-phosphate deacetylase
MIVLSGAELVLPDRILAPGTLTMADGRIVDVRAGAPHGGGRFAFHGHYIVPGFIDVHMHGVDGVDTLDAGDPVRALAAALPRYGVTAFCPTTVACPPEPLARVLAQIAHARQHPVARAARVLPAHLESNFISPDYAGAQPPGCLRSPRAAIDGHARPSGGAGGAGGAGESGESGESGGSGGSRESEFDAADILREIERAAPDVGIVTLAPELDGAVDLIAWLTARGHRVSLGHSGASYEQALAAIAAGARQATHLFNRMARLDHRAPGLAGAVLQTEDVAAEIICDAIHVHPALVRTAIAAKHPSRIMAISDGTAAAGLPDGSRARLGGREITARGGAAFLADGTLAGSALTMAGAFRVLVERMGLSLVEAVTMCATTPARELGLIGHGVLAAGSAADVVVLDSRLSVVQTYVGGELAYSA